jgi:hypothetical protein
MTDSRPGGFTLAFAVSAGAVALGLLAMPYGYYMLLRLVLTIVAAYGLYLTWEPASPLSWLLIGLIVLYNPIAPVTLGDKGLWTIVNLATLGVFWFVRRRLTLPRS